jgi:hypothetical protein
MDFLNEAPLRKTIGNVIHTSSLRFLERRPIIMKRIIFDQHATGIRPGRMFHLLSAWRQARVPAGEK